MNTAANFHLFGALPTELRLMIWEEALSMPTVCAIVRKHTRPDEPSRNFAVQSIGPAPSLIGLACKEARRQLIHSFTSPSACRRRGFFRFAGAGYWLDLDQTVLHIGDSDDAGPILESLREDKLFRPRAAALCWHQFGSLARSCQRLASSLSLRILVLQRHVTEDMVPPVRHEPLDVKGATQLTRLLDYAGPAMQDRGRLSWQSKAHGTVFAFEEVLIKSSVPILLLTMVPLEDLEKAAVSVIDLLKGIEEFHDASIAVIGGLALWQYLPSGRTTEDVDFIISVRNAPESVKQKLLDLPNSPFVQRAQLFYFKMPSVGEIQIDMVPIQQAPYVPEGTIKLRDVPRDTVPYISIVDLFIFKIFSCGLRAEPRKRRVDASDAENLLARIATPLNLNSTQKALLEPCVDDLVANGKRSKEWWLRILGLSSG